MNVAKWLRNLGLGDYVETFAANHIDAGTLGTLTLEDLKEIGIVSLGHRKKLLAAIAALSDAGEAPSTTATGRVASDRAERRQVSVLFADIAGYTALSAELGAEATHALLGAFFEHVDGIIIQYGGTIDKHIGDCAMAVFGAPVAHSDDMLRAVKAALHIHRAMAGLSENLGRALRAHVGIATGEVIASSTGSTQYREYTVTGETVNLASRLTELAGDGETIVADDVVRALGPVLALEPRGRHAVKGFAEPVAVWSLEGLREDDRTASGMLVGRRAELEQCLAALRACREGEAGAVVHIRGEPGIGKTRLMDELHLRAGQEGFETHRVGVFDFGMGLEQAPLRLLAESLVRIGAHERGTEAGETGWLTARGVPPDYQPLVAELVGMTLATDQKMQLDAMSNVTRDAARAEALAWLACHPVGEAPQFIALEDVHWADAQTIEVLGALGRASRQTRLVLAVTTRIEADPLERLRQITAGARLMSIELAPLTARDARALAQAIIGEDNPLLESCIERAGGNPLFLEQLIRYSTSADQTTVPGSIQSIVLSSLDSLSPADRVAAQVASVLGQQFSLETLRHLVGDNDYEPLALATTRLIRPLGDTWQFVHALIREGVYASILNAERQALHARAADWFSERDPILFAEHLDRAGDLRAPRAFLAAAERVGEGYRLDQALVLAERGAAIARAPEDVCDLQLMRAAMMLETGQAAVAAEACRIARDVAPDPVARAKAILGEAGALRLSDDVDVALELLVEAEGALVAGNCLAELSRLQHMRGNLLFPKGRIDTCLAAHQQALDYAQQCGSRRHEVRARGGLGDAYYALGRHQTAHRHFANCVELARLMGLGRVEVANLPMLGLTLMVDGKFAEALQVGERAIAAAAAARQARAEIIGCHVMMVVQFMSGQASEVKAYYDRAQDRAREIGARRFEPENMAFLAEALRQQNHREEAVERLLEALALARETGMDYCGPVILGYLALAAIAMPETREAALHEGGELIAKGGLSHNILFFCYAAIESCLETSDWGRMDELVDKLEAAFSAEPLRFVQFIVGRARLVARAGQGEQGEALAGEIASAIEACRTMGCVSFLPTLETAARRAAYTKGPEV